MIISTVFTVLFFIVILLIIFFMFSILFPALKNFSLSVEQPIFSDVELHYVVSDVSKVAKRERCAVVLCSHEKTFDKARLYHTGAQSCSLVNEIYESVNDCRFSCIGLGDCIAVCPQEAIVIENGTAVVTDLCSGCGTCVPACPKHIITLMPLNIENCVLCINEGEKLTTCTAYQKEQKFQIKVKKGFKLWKNCYRICGKGTRQDSSI